MNYIYKIAGKYILIDSLYPDVHNYCAGYRADNFTPDLCVKISQDDIDYERSKSEAYFSDGWLEISAVHRKIAEAMPKYNTFLIHGSALCVEDSAFMFTAPSGTGKSTHTKLWREFLGEHVIMVNDDKPLVKIHEGYAEIFGTPFCGKEGLNSDTSAILKAICILERAEQNHITQITFREAYPELFRQTYRPSDRNTLAKILGLLDSLGQFVKFYRLGCNMNLDAAVLAYNAMKG